MFTGNSPLVSIELAYVEWENILFYLDTIGKTNQHAVDSGNKIRRQIPFGSIDDTMDPVDAAQRALSCICNPCINSDVKEAIQELAHGLAACERRRRNAR